MEKINKPRRNPVWSREELILALNLYFEIESSQFTSSNPKVIELSEILNKLNIHSDRPDEIRFRNPNGVSMKLSNFLRFDPNYKGTGLERGGKLEGEIWKYYAGNKKLLKEKTDEILSAISNAKFIEGDRKMTNSVKLAKFWLDLDAVKTKLDNELIPVSGYLGVDDDELKDSMEQLSKAIADHLNQFKLTAEKIRDESVSGAAV